MDKVIKAIIEDYEHQLIIINGYNENMIREENKFHSYHLPSILDDIYIKCRQLDCIELVYLDICNKIYPFLKYIIKETRFLFSDYNLERRQAINIIEKRIKLFNQLLKFRNG